jgi:hypothetical protein
MLSELEKNSIDHLLRTLEDWASSERQISYKKAVPFVHVPIELLAQWDHHNRMLREVDWFRTLFTESEQAKLFAFNATVERYCEVRGDHYADVAEILADQEWQKLMQAAGDLLKSLALRLDNPEKKSLARK